MAEKIAGYKFNQGQQNDAEDKHVLKDQVIPGKVGKLVAKREEIPLEYGSLKLE